MKAFKGCINESCKAYKKKHYKNDDNYCLICGQKLYFVCADCWKQFDDNKEKYCILCKAARDDKKDKFIEDAKGVVIGVGTATTFVAGTMKTLAMNAKQIEKAGKTIADVGGKVIKAVVKK